jgi:hypothetical protein
MHSRPELARTCQHYLLGKILPDPSSAETVQLERVPELAENLQELAEN